MDGLADLAHRASGWLAAIAAVALILGIPWVLGWIAVALS